MKQLIVLCSMIFLGIVIYNLILGDGENSVLSAMSEMWKSGIGIRSYSE